MSRLTDEQGAALIFDLGAHAGEDTSYYLSRGFYVVGVDADRNLVDGLSQEFAADIESGRLQLVHAAVVGHGDGEIDFYVSQYKIWNSLLAKISTREQYTAERVRVPTTDLPSLIARHGVPHYCKIDLEGGDLAAVESLQRAEGIPQFVSAESECIGQDERVDEGNALAVLGALCTVGYVGFKLVEQRSLVVLEPDRSFFPRADRYVSSADRRRLPIVDEFLDPFVRNRRRLARRLRYAFPKGASGPFGDDLDGDWLDHETARATLLFHRREYFSTREAVSYGFWCDWHAKL